jgi:O-antigen ligase
VIHWCFLLFVFSISGVADIGFTSAPLLFSNAVGLLFFATYFWHYNPLLVQISAQRRAWPSPPRVFWWFLAYVVIYFLSALLLPEKFAPSFSGRLFTLLQLLIFFWVAADLCKEERIMRQVLLTYAVASSLLAVGMLLQLPAFSPSFEDIRGVERSSVMGYNGNMLSTLWALAVVALAGLCLHPAYRLITKLLYTCLALMILAAMVKTGSRSGMGALLIGFLVYLVPHWRAQRKLGTVLLGLLGIAAAVYFIMHSSSATQRWKETYEGQLDGREKIVPAALKMFIESPLVGWQPVRFQYELGRRLGTETRDAHNLFLHLLLEVGIVGTVPFLIGFWMCAQEAWQARTGRLGLLPIALFLTALAGTMTHTYLLQKWFWLALACTATSLAAGHATRPRMLLIRRSLGK